MAGGGVRCIYDVGGGRDWHGSELLLGGCSDEEAAGSIITIVGYARNRGDKL